MAKKSHDAYSMTGYGKGEARKSGVRSAIEVRSTNHRYRDVSIRLPRAAACFEERLRQLVHSRVSRGKVDVFVAYEDESAQKASVRVDAALASAILEAARKVSLELGITNDIAASDLLRLPDVFVFEAADGLSASSPSDGLSASSPPDGLSASSPPDGLSASSPSDELPASIPPDGAIGQSERVWASLGAAMEAALDAHAKMRAAEGERLVVDIRSKLNGLALLLETVERRAPFIPVEHKAKLEARIAELMGARTPKGAQPERAVSENPPPLQHEAFTENEAARIAMEAAIIADRCCVDEEIVRLRSHFAQVEKALASGEPLGRKLDFLLQEINREINTIGSKTNDAEVAACVVDMKSEAEKIREQAQNLE